MSAETMSLDYRWEATLRHGEYDGPAVYTARLLSFRPEDRRRRTMTVRIPAAEVQKVAGLLAKLDWREGGHLLRFRKRQDVLRGMVVYTPEGIVNYFNRNRGDRWDAEIVPKAGKRRRLSAHSWDAHSVFTKLEKLARIDLLDDVAKELPSDRQRRRRHRR